MSSRKRVVILGSSFAGLTAALELRKRVGNRHDIVVLDPRPDFTFIPSLIWLPLLARNGSANGKTPSARVMTGPQAHWAKLAFERIFLASRRRGAPVL